MMLIGVVNSNSFSFENDVKRQLDEIVELKEVDSSDLMEYVIDIIGLTPELMGDTAVCYENADTIYQICYMDYDQNKMEMDESNINMLCSILNVGQRKIYGPCIILCSNISENGTCVNRNISIDELTVILNRKYVHTGLIVRPNATVDEFEFKEKPMEIIPKEERENFQYLEIPLFRFNIIGMFQKDPEPNEINKLATKLVGTKKIHGTAVFVIKSTENDFLDFDKKLFQDLLKACEGPLSNRNLTEEEQNGGKVDNNKLPVIINKHIILRDKLKKYKHICNACKEEVHTDILYCSGCHRVAYHNRECQVNDWNSHKSECLHNVKPIHTIME